jgi:hypothetical protein
MKTAPRDLWGNVRIPRLEMLPSFGKGNSSRQQEWLLVPHLETPEHFSSLAGTPIIGLPAANGNDNLTADFTLEASYMSLVCSAWDTFRESEQRLAYYKKIWKNHNPFRHAKGKDFNTTMFLDGRMPAASMVNNSVVAQDPRERVLHFASARRNSGESEYTISATNCSVTETHVEAAVTCTSGRNCRATKIRRSQVDARPERSTPLDSYFRMMDMSTTMTNLQIHAETERSDTEYFLHDSTKMALPETSSIDLSHVPPPLFSSRLLLVLNTWYQLSLVASKRVFLNDNPLNISAYGLDCAQMQANEPLNASVAIKPCVHLCTRSTQATLTLSVEVYSFSPMWISLLIGSSSVLLVIGLAGIMLERRTNVPDIIGYAASMSYNNRYFELPGRKGGVLNAICRTRILRDLPVTAGDISGSQGVGRLAFTTSADVRALDKQRMYH